jgi:hypothetical protein
MHAIAKKSKNAMAGNLLIKAAPIKQKAMAPAKRFDALNSANAKRKRI